MPTLTALWKGEVTCRTPAAKPEPRDCRGRMQAHSAGMRAGSSAVGSGWGVADSITSQPV